MRYALVVLFSIALAASAFDPNVTAENKNRPTSFVGVPWGSTREEASRILGARAGALAPEELPPDKSKLELTGGNFSGQPVERWTLEFVNQRLAAATIVLKNDSPATPKFRELKQQLTVKYGPPVRDGKPPLALGNDKKERRAQQRVNPEQKLFGNLTQWKFTPNLNDKEPKSIELILGAAGGILTADENALVVSVRYVNDAFLAPSTKAASTPKPAGPDDL